jgi:hypothetical protein
MDGTGGHHKPSSKKLYITCFHSYAKFRPKMMIKIVIIIIKIMGHEYKGGLSGMENQWVGGGRKERLLEVNMIEAHCVYNI